MNNLNTSGISNHNYFHRVSPCFSLKSSVYPECPLIKILNMNISSVDIYKRANVSSSFVLSNHVVLLRIQHHSIVWLNNFDISFPSRMEPRVV